MDINLTVILSFTAVLILIALLYKNSTLDKIAFLPEEKILFEEGGVRVEQAGSPRSSVFSNCIVRITDKRIIIAQKILLSKRYALRHVIAYKRLLDSTNLKTSIKKGYLSMTISTSDLKLSDTDGVTTVRIEIPESVLTKRRYITFKTAGKDYYLNL